jgi:hypothetical protein
LIDINDRDSRISAAATRSKMIRIAITQRVRRHRRHHVGYEAERTDKGEVFI